MFTSDGKWLQSRLTSTAKKLPLSDALKLDRPLRKTSSLLWSTHQASPTKSFLTQELPTLKELLMLTHTLSNIRDTKISSLSEIVLESTLPELNLQPSIKLQLSSTTWPNSWKVKNWMLSMMVTLSCHSF
jgi:hypothetical protein